MQVISCSVWANYRNLQAVKPYRYNFSVHDDVYFVGIHQLFAELLGKNAHMGKGELTVVFSCLLLIALGSLGWIYFLTLDLSCYPLWGLQA